MAVRLSRLGNVTHLGRSPAGGHMPFSDIDDHHLLYEFRIDRALWTEWTTPDLAGASPLAAHASSKPRRTLTTLRPITPRS